jgi:two-component system, OmpR family, copper resistance phosphate regulon response regulator CusR
MTTILLVEDDAGIGQTLQSGLAEEGFTVHLVGTVDEAEGRLSECAIDLVILDLGLPGRDGMELLRLMREEGRGTPVIILTARAATEDRVGGLEAGADDYVVKPFSFAELVARIHAIRRRVDKQAHVATVGDLRIDLLERRCTLGEQEIVLTQREFELLAYLATCADRVVTREMLAQDVWRVTSRATPLDNVIDVHVSRLRSKLNEHTDRPLLQTIRGVGYVLGKMP